MKVRAVKSFSALMGSRVTSFPHGKVFDLPPGVDWLRVGLVEVVSIDVTPPVQAAPPAEAPTPTLPKPAARRRKKVE